MAKYEGSEVEVTGVGCRIGIVASRFNAAVVDSLLDGATSCLEAHGVVSVDVTVVRVPGAWEIPLVLERLARGGYDGLVALGAVIRGETPHFDYVAGVSSRGAADVALRYGIPVGFGLLTCDTAEQARQRAGDGPQNKGWEAARATLEMIRLLDRLPVVAEQRP